MKFDLIDRYAKEVGRRLPRRIRADVEAELGSLLRDSLRDRMAGKKTLDAAAWEAGEIAVLREFGSPEQAAARYAPPRRCLIGPNVFDLYLTVLLAAGAGITALVTLLAVVSLTAGEEPFLPSLADFLILSIKWLMTTFGWTTLVFAVLGRLLPEEEKPASESENWDPLSLPEAADWTVLDVRAVAFETAGLVVGLALLNLFPRWAGWTVPAEGGTAEWFAVLSPSLEFFRLYLPLWNVNFLLTILMDLSLLRRGRWERATRAAEFLLDLFGAGILAAMAFGPPLVEMQGEPSGMLSGLLRAGLFVAFVVMAADALGRMPVILRASQRAAAPGKRND